MSREVCSPIEGFAKDLNKHENMNEWQQPQKERSATSQRRGKRKCIFYKSRKAREARLHKRNKYQICAVHKNNPAATLLVHEIDGFLIEESNVPFDQLYGLKEVPEPAEDRDELMSLLPTACKFCGEPLSEDRARWGKRFCSTSCNKQYSVNCSQRVKKALKRKTNATYARSKQVGETSSKQGIAGYSRASSMDRIYEENIFDEDTEDQHSQTERIPLGFGIEEEDIEEELFEGVETISNYSFSPAVKWSVTEVDGVILSCWL